MRKPTELSIRAHRLYGEVHGLCTRFDVSVGKGRDHDTASLAKKLKQFDSECERLKREYADVFASKDAGANAFLVRHMLKHARSSLRGQLVASTIDPKEYE